MLRTTPQRTRSLFGDTHESTTMARFNTKTKTGPDTINMAGGEAHSQSAELELVSLLLTSFASDKFYEGATEQVDRLGKLIEANDPLFVARALVFARDEFGMRSITHAGAAMLGKKASGTKWGTDFYNAIVVRPDDMTETLAFTLANSLPLTNAMRKGFAKAFARLTPYQMAKYRGDGKGVKLLDVANLVRPKQSTRNAGALSALMTGQLKSDATWEAMLSAAGSDAVKKAKAWHDLLTENKLGYFALLRNLRNIAQQAPEALDLALAQLKDPNRVGKARVLPFRYQAAYNELIGQRIPRERDILWSIDEAAELALANVPKLDGDTLVALDVSGSMEGRPLSIGSLFAAILAKANQADLLTFATGHHWNTVERMGVLPMSRNMKAPGGGTDFNQVFVGLKKKYDRIIILSDMQAWVDHHTPAASFAAYRRLTGADPHIWSFDLNGHGTMQFPEGRVKAVAGFSEKVFGLMAMLEKDPRALVDRVKEYEFAEQEATEAE